MKKSLFLILAFFSILQLRAQEFIVKSSEKGLFISHTVAPKENYYSIGRMYAIPPKEIEQFNGLVMSNGLNVGQVVKIPLSASNFTQTAATEGARPVYYVVGEGEGLYRVSLKNNNVLMANIRKWNRLTNDQVTAGKKLVIGFLSPAEGVAVTETPVQRNETVAKPVVQEKPLDPAPKPQVEKPKTQQPSAPVSNAPVSDGNGGFFKGSFEQQIKVHPLKKDETVTAGIFKTASGWQDAKYYALMDGVEPGTIVRIINPANNKAIYAKVLGEMGAIRQNQGYNVRMSNAAAVALEAGDLEKFVVRVNY